MDDFTKGVRRAMQRLKSLTPTQRRGVAAATQPTKLGTLVPTQHGSDAIQSQERKTATTTNPVTATHSHLASSHGDSTQSLLSLNMVTAGGGTSVPYKTI